MGPWFCRQFATRLMAAGVFAALGLGLVAPAWAARCTLTLRADGNTAAIQHAIGTPSAKERRSKRSPVVCLRPGEYKGARLYVGRSVTLRRVGKGRAVLDAGGVGRVLTVAKPGLEVVLEGVTLTGGKADEGAAVALTADSSLTLREATIMFNHASLRGGGGVLATAGQLTLERSRVVRNHGQQAAGVDARGTGHVVLRHALIADNRSMATGEGGVRLAEGARLDVEHSTIAYNHGHAVYVQPRGGATVPKITISDSVLLGDPAAIRIPRRHASTVDVFRSVLYGDIGFVALDLESQRALPGFVLGGQERYRIGEGSPAIALARCKTRQSKRDLLGKRRPSTCTAGAYQADKKAVRATLRARREAAKARAADNAADHRRRLR
jgi:hypothetical protein